MKFHRLLLCVVLMALSTMAFAQSHETHKSADKVAPSGAQKAFEKLKSLAGSWEGPVSVQPPQPEMQSGKPIQVSLRVTSMGNALMHEMRSPERPDDPITMFYLDTDRLLLTHYCDAGNRPRMVGKISPDGKRVEFEFLDVAGSTKYGHMRKAAFTIIDANRHIEEWVFILPGDKAVHARFDLKRKSDTAVSQVR
ncbi:MAG TPA: hypothetical protein VD837_19365 [Terriglobales bacterium]|nr:hypothetical protein [Terriglobales bacterium]